MIGYYAHHHGSGHLHRAGAVAAALDQPVLGLSGRAAPTGWTGPWVRLPDDATGVDRRAADVTAGGVLHWAPRRHTGLRDRGVLVSAALRDVDLLVVDVSVEVALLARLHGVPVVVMAQPGERTDRPHRMAYDLAERLLAPWPARPAPDWPASWRAKTVHLGALSRFDDRPPVPAPGGHRVLVLWGAGGRDVDAAALTAAAAATPQWSWTVLGATGPPGANLAWRGWVDDVWPELCGADVVVTHAGQNALAEVAAARRAAVVVPQDRPHDEQHATGRALRHLGVTVTAWPEPRAWAALLAEAAERGGDGWARWSSGDGAARAAKELIR